MLGQSDSTARPFASQLRKDMTDAERRRWHRLRGGQLGARFRRQHPFEGYILDFVCLERRLAVEVDGSQHMERAAHDAARTAVLERAGFRGLRSWNNEVLGEMEGWWRWFRGRWGRGWRRVGGRGGVGD